MTRFLGRFMGLILLCSSLVMARQLSTEGEAIALSQPGEYYLSPQWSPDGEQVAAGGPNYTGLYLLDFPTGNTVQLSDAYSAGWGFAWSPDGRTIASKISHFDKRRRSHTLVVYDVNTGAMETVSDTRPRMSGVPEWTSDGAHIYLTHADHFQVFSLSGENQPLTSRQINFVRDGKFLNHLTGAASRDIVHFQDQDRIYSYAISPDGQYVAYSTAGQNLWVAKVNGEDRLSLGRGSEPCWSPDGEWITFMLTFDDGHSITGSDIHAIKRDGSSPFQITKTTDIHEMNPQWSPDGNWIVYDTDARGQLLVQQVVWR